MENKNKVFAEPAWLLMARQNLMVTSSQKRIDKTKSNAYSAESSTYMTNTESDCIEDDALDPSKPKTLFVSKSSSSTVSSAAVKPNFKATAAVKKSFKTADAVKQSFKTSASVKRGFKSVSAVGSNVSYCKPDCSTRLFDSEESLKLPATSLENALNSARRLILTPREPKTSAQVLKKPQKTSSLKIHSRRNSINKQRTENISPVESSEIRKVSNNRITRRAAKQKLETSSKLDTSEVPEIKPIVKNKSDTKNSLNVVKPKKVTRKTASVISNMKSVEDSCKSLDPPIEPQLIIPKMDSADNFKETVVNSNLFPIESERMIENLGKSKSECGSPETKSSKSKWNAKMIKALYISVNKFSLAEPNYWQLVASDLSKYDEFTGVECAKKFNELEDMLAEKSKKVKQRKPKVLKPQDIKIPLKGNTRNWKMEQMIKAVALNEAERSSYQTPKHIQELKEADIQQIEAASTNKRKSVPLWMMVKSQIDKMGTEVMFSDSESVAESARTEKGGDKELLGFNVCELPKKSLDMHRFIQKHRKKAEEVLKLKSKANKTTTKKANNGFYSQKEFENLIKKKERIMEIEEKNETKQALLWTVENSNDTNITELNELYDLAKTYELSDCSS